jgi:hypothetical protein
VSAHGAGCDEVGFEFVRVVQKKLGLVVQEVHLMRLVQKKPH